MSDELHVLLVEQNPEDRKVISLVLNNAFGNITIKEVFSMAELKAALRTGNYSIVLTDYQMDTFTGFDVVNEVRALERNIPVILVTGELEMEAAMEAIKLQVDDCVVKNFKYINRLPSIIKRVLKKAPIEQAKRDTKDPLSDTLNNYKQIFENSSELIQSLWMDGSFINVNTSWCETLGYVRNEVPSLNMSDIIHESSKSEYESLLKNATAEDKHHQVKLTLKSSSANKVYVEGSFNIRLHEGKPISTHWILRDVTSSKEIEKLLWDINDQYISAFEYAPYPMVLGDERGVVLQINRAACELVGYTYDEMIGMHLTGITHPEDLTDSLQNYQDLQSGKIDSYTFNKRYRHKSGKYVLVEARATLIRNNNGQPRFVIAQVKEVNTKTKYDLSA
jgi:PAS domain S-box-containing protein